MTSTTEAAAAAAAAAVPATLTLRINALQSLLQGCDGAAKRLAVLTSELSTVLAGNKSLQRFVDEYDELPIHQQEVETDRRAQVALVLEAEQDLRDALDQLTRVAELDRRDVAAAGRLDEYKSLLPRLDKLVERTPARSLETAHEVLQQYHDTVDVISNVFLTLGDQIGELERQVARIERSRASEKA